MKCVPNWQRIVLHSWSFQINVVIALTSALEAGIEYAVDGKIGSALVVAGVSLLAAGARLIKQATVSGDDE